MLANASFLAAALLVAAVMPVIASQELVPSHGEAAPPLVLKTAAGNVVDLAALRGKVVLVNFWATWCPPCIEEMPALARLRARLGSRGFEVLAVNQGEMPARVTAYAERAGLDLPMPLDREKSVARAWKVRALPTTFVVDTAGRVRLYAEGELDTGPALEAAIVPLLPRERQSTASR